MHAAADTTTACENCGTMLQGEYCHACGQSAHNPLHDVKHALEEVFESFWHLDGRVFRTLRDLLVPGRVACNYLRGQRVRYIPPLRLFLVLIVLTFFVGRLTIGDGDEADTGKAAPHVVTVDRDAHSTFDDARTEAEVQRRLDATLASIAEAKKKVPLMAPAMATAEVEARTKAAARVAQLRAEAASRAKAGAPAPATPAVAGAAISATRALDAKADAPTPPAAAPAHSTRDREATTKSMDEFVRGIKGARLRDPKRLWDAKTNPVDVPWLPAFGDRWFNHRVENFTNNVDRLNRDGTLIFDLMLAAVPSALFVLVPVFALMLKLLYLGSGRSYVEHLVIAFYSHAFLLLTLFASFVLALLPIGGAAVPITLLLWGWAGVYLLLMQRRVYAQSWPVTVVKFGLVAFLYQFLIVGAAVYIVFAGVTSGQ